MKRALITIMLIALGFAQNSLSADKINALWNTSGPEGLVGIWIYPLTGNCSDLRSKAQPLVIGAKVGNNSFKYSELWLCFKLPKNPQDGANKCTAGSITLHFDEASNTYSGEYSFELAKGEKVSDTFLAQYCPKAQ